MTIFTIDSEKLSPVSEILFKLEKDLQKLVERNLKEVFGYNFVTSEFQLSGLRIDTLAFDKESNSFVIIEYKREKSSSVIDQGYAYLSLLLNNKAEFILNYNETQSVPLKKKDVDWTQTKVIFVAHSFTPHQQQAIKFKDLPIELWEVKKFSNKTILFNQIRSSKKNESINKLDLKSDVVRSVSREIKTYSEEYHFDKNGSKKTITLYEILKEKIMTLGDEIEPVFRKHYIAFKSKSNFIYVNIQKNVLHVDISLQLNQLIDPKKIVRDMSKIGHYGSGNSRVTVKETKDIQYLIFLIEQAYSKLK